MAELKEAVGLFKETAAQEFAAGLTEINKTLHEKLNVLAVPQTHTLKDLQSYMPQSRRFAGSFVTSHFDSLFGFVNDPDLSDGSTPAIFVDDREFAAKAILNIGSNDEPGHGDNVATLKLDQTAVFKSFLNVAGKQLSQRDLAEWLEDNEADVRGVYYIDDDIATGNVDKGVSAAKIVGIVRRMKIDVKASSESVESNYSSNASSFASQEINAGNKLPTIITLHCSSHHGLPPYLFSFRLRVRFDDTKPTFVIARINPEKEREDNAEAFCSIIDNELRNKAKLFIGRWN